MYQKQLDKIWELVEKIKSDKAFQVIFVFLKWFYRKLIINFYKDNPNLKLNKWEIYLIELWQNIWSELNKKRPCIIYSDYFYNNWDCITVIPLKSYKWKINRNVQIFIKKDKINSLDMNSIVDISTIRQVSKKRIILKLWKLENVYIEKINKKLMKYLRIKKR